MFLQDLLSNFKGHVSPQDPNFETRLEEWWKRIRSAAKKSNLSRYLPEDYKKMQTK